MQAIVLSVFFLCPWPGAPFPRELARCGAYCTYTYIAIAEGHGPAIGRFGAAVISWQPIRGLACGALFGSDRPQMQVDHLHLQPQSVFVAVPGLGGRRWDRLEGA